RSRHGASSPITTNGRAQTDTTAMTRAARETRSERTTVSPRETAWGAYAQIAEVLRQRISSGDLAPGSLMPSEAALCDEFAVVRNAVRRALASLEDEGLIETLPGRGRVVRGEAPTQYEYRRIAAELRERIERGDLAVGDALPSEAAIVEK